MQRTLVIADPVSASHAGALTPAQMRTIVGVNMTIPTGWNTIQVEQGSNGSWEWTGRYRLRPRVPSSRCDAAVSLPSHARRRCTRFRWSERLKRSNVDL